MYSSLLNKNYLLSLLERYRLWCQSLYDKVMLYCLEVSVLRYLIISYHIFLFYFRYGAELLGAKIERYISLSNFALTLSIICSRLHTSGYMLLFCLLFIRIDFQVLNMARFYKQHPIVFKKNFPQAFPPRNTRGVWSKAQKIVVEAATNPQMQAVSVAVVGALAWKCLDVYDTQTTKEIANQDRIAENARSEADRIAENTRSEADRNAENARSEADRIAENKRLAFDKMCSPEFHELSAEQKEALDHTVKTGRLKSPLD